ncbi:hypothetical protein [Reyranella soli]|uniref:Uncharacterized protein n=1 Tax=Reyranella soli TaxID=1230389 RepID=A0A512NNJ5_9HYPH|nr:hypothetical protein [Reyranella soli]GEP60515.1 hypothetical protein RSO01_76810 [Reyranella soli]
MTTSAELFDRACRALFGEPYVAQVAARLAVDKNTVGKWRDGKSRIPPPVWLEISIMIEIRHHELSDLKSAVFAITEATVRVYESDVGGLPVGASADGTFPVVEFTTGTNGDWRVGFWGKLGDNERRLPRGTLAYRLMRNGKTGDPIPLTARR